MQRIYLCFPMGKTLAFTCSYDDGKVMDHRLVELMNRYGIKGTFHLNSAFFQETQGHRYPYIKEKDVARLYKGHEIACHTCHHITMTRTNSVLNIEEVLQNRKDLETICQKPVTGFSYPNGCYDDEVISTLKSCGIRYARTTKSTMSFDLPTDFMRWHPTCHHREDIFALKDRFLSVHYGERLQVFYLWGHSYEFERDDHWERIEQFFQQMQGHPQVWYATNHEIEAYMDAGKRLIYFADQSSVYNPSGMDVWIQVDDRCLKIKANEQLKLKE